FWEVYLVETESRWKKIRSSLASAFIIEHDENWEPSDRQKEIVEKLAKWVIRRRLTLPAIMSLESITPLNYLGSQAMVFFHPFVAAFLNTGDYKEFQQMLENRQSMHFMIKILEKHEEDFIARQKAEKRAAQENKE
ncbi:hypothetical protein K8T06_03990, partial [bacterium]|nr:hypothetical protein [bacterium]